MNAAVSSTCAPLVFVAKTTIGWPQQEQFMRFSGDRNPMHTDPLAARRTPPGDVVVYGMHMLLWSLDRLVAAGHVDRSLTRLQIRFLKWIYLQDQAGLWFRPPTSASPARFELRVGDMTALTCNLHRDVQTDEPAGRAEAGVATAPEATRRTKPRVLLLKQIEGQQGEVPVASTSAAASLFPAMAKSFGPELAAEIATCSYVVGMQAPGLYSIDSSAELHLRSPLLPGASTFAHRVAAVDARFRRARIQVSGAAIWGTLEAFVRHPPVRQAGMEQVRAKVTAGEFARMRALVVGGSRGLGEVAAKCIAAGGGHCTLTYAVGEQDAQRVATEICDTGGSASVTPYDARQPAAAQIANLTGSVTHLLYFASGPMFRPKGALFSPDRFADLNAVYLAGFHDLCGEMLRSGLLEAGKQMVTFYPSSTLLDDRGAGLTEFAASKAAGEQLCRDMARFLPGLRIVTKRLPRLLTDQTAPVVPERFPDAVEVLLPVLREL